jgi:hypothetical protein
MTYLGEEEFWFLRLLGSGGELGRGRRRSEMLNTVSGVKCLRLSWATKKTKRLYG